MVSLKGLRWLDMIAIAVVVAVAGALWQSAPALFGDAAQDHGDVLREALAVATDECYASYRGAQLQACLAGAMQAHLEALGEHDGAEPEQGSQPRTAGNRL